MKHKKSTISINMLILLAFCVFMFLILAYIVPNLLKKGSSETSAYLSDWDCDGVADSFDKCKCDKGEEDNDGCPTTGVYKDGYDAGRKEGCKEKMKKTSPC